MPRRKKGRKLRWKHIKWGVLLLLLSLAVAAGVVAGYILVYNKDLPQISSLEEHQPSIISDVYDRNGNEIGEFALEKRILVKLDQIPDPLIKAIIAVEDAHFFDHPGLDILGILRAARENIRAGRVVEGGSTLTQQLAKLLFLSPERNFERKMKEAILAMRIESRYSKDEILTFYCNQIFLGHNRYGVEAASRYYFGKQAKDLTLEECALLAGIPQRPTAYSPIRHLDAALNRRNHVLERMAVEGFISRDESEHAKKSPIVLRVAEDEPAGSAPYFVEEVRQQLAETYGTNRLYREGLKVHTTLDSRLQQLAGTAVRDGLRALDKKQGWRGPERNLFREGMDIESYKDISWHRPLGQDDIVRGVVTAASSEAVILKVGSREAVLHREGTEWTNRRNLDALLAVGDVVEVKVKELNLGKGRVDVALEQEPAVEGALVALDVKTGQILAMVGGYSFDRSKFNRAVQAWRQTGSAFKPVYYAAGFENGLTPADTMIDQPIAIEDPWTHKIYAPENYSREYYGLTTIRRALEKSRNPFSVQLLQKIGYGTAIDFSKRLGFSGQLQPYPSLALGVFETTLLELTTVYQAFANKGVQCQPYYVLDIRDRDGHLVAREQPRAQQVLREDTAFVTTYVLEGVIQRGTAYEAKRLKLPLAGKTGTTDDYTDAWFLGYSPDIICGVWVGYDQKKSLGPRMTGAEAALPIWIEFMDQAVDRSKPGEFTPPANVDFVNVDADTGLRAISSCPRVISEAFIRGTEPVTYCSETMHHIMALPLAGQKAALARLDFSEESLTPSSSHFE